MRHIRKSFVMIALISLIIGLLPAASYSQNPYCATPPFVSLSLPPNIVLIVDNSGSMFRFAYFDGWDTPEASDDNWCSSSYCTDFNPDYTYYGYFNPNYWYKYDGSYGHGWFYPTAAKSDRSKASDEWDGNFLNWLLMRRVDIIRKVLTGGKYSQSGSDYILETEIADCNARGRYKKISNAGDYTPFSGTKSFTVHTYGGWCDGSGSGYSTFTVSGHTYNGRVNIGDSPPIGIIQKIGTKVRWGLAYYHVNAPHPQGGYISQHIPSYSLNTLISDINSKRPDSNTPLAETLWTVVGYYAQQASMEGGPGPRYNSGDYQINIGVDPYNLGTASEPSMAWCAKSFVILITDGEPCQDGYLPSSIANYANGRSDFNCDSRSNDPDDPCYIPSCSGGYVPGIEDVALYAHINDLRSDLDHDQTLTIYTVFAFGAGSKLLQYAAINGGFKDLDGDGKPFPDSSNTCGTANPDPYCKEWDEDGDGVPDNYFSAPSGYELEEALTSAITDILKRVSSGSAASVLATGEHSGANILQALFYPTKYFGTDQVNWIGKLQALWFYLGPFVSNIREDTVQDKELNLEDDYVISFFLDTQSNQTKVHVWEDTNGDGQPDNQQQDKSIEDIASIWEGGKNLWSMAPEDRKIWTDVDLNSDGKITPDDDSFIESYASELRPYLAASDDTEAARIIAYIRGEDVYGSRNRTVTIGSEEHVWKLGDIVYSTPKVVSWIPLNRYHESPPKGYSDSTYREFINSQRESYTEPPLYKDRGMVFVGANDGMLHAFRLGKLKIEYQGEKIAKLEPIKDQNGSDLTIGKEAWAFIPKNVLPYLKYLMDPEYCHLYYVDLDPYVFDASICNNYNSSTGVCDGYGEMSDNNEKDSHSWRTILIGGLRFGGACGCTDPACVNPPDEIGCVDSDGNPTDCSNPGAIKAVEGYSSYFALDITDPENPVFLWEFTDADLGFSTTGPAIIRIGDTNKNGKWFVIFGTGPSNYNGEAKGTPYLYVIDLAAAAQDHHPENHLVKINLTSLIGSQAFLGRIVNSQGDLLIGTAKEGNYKDDVFYVGYSYYDSGEWKGGVLRIVTAEDPDPNNWKISKLIDDIGPVTASVTHLQDPRNKNLWVFFGEGRYFTPQDDSSAQRRIYGIKDPCYNAGTYQMDPSCTTKRTLGQLNDVTDISGGVPTDEPGGWYLDLDPEDQTHLLGAERNITDPLVTPQGWVFFTTFAPTSDVCGFGGTTYLWAFDYSTGGIPEEMRGRGLLQVSTGVIEELNLTQVFTEKCGRRTQGMTGAPPPSSGLTIVIPPNPVKKVYHWLER